MDYVYNSPASRNFCLIYCYDLNVNLTSHSRLTRVRRKKIECGTDHRHAHARVEIIAYLKGKSKG